MENEERYKIIAEFEDYLESGREDATPEQLRRWLVAVNQGAITNPKVRHRAIINGITINYLQMERTIKHLEETIKHLDAQNDRTQRLVIILTYVAIAVGILQVVVSLIPR